MIFLKFPLDPGSLFDISEKRYRATFFDDEILILCTNMFKYSSPYDFLIANHWRIIGLSDSSPTCKNLYFFNFLGKWFQFDPFISFFVQINFNNSLFQLQYQFHLSSLLSLSEVQEKQNYCKLFRRENIVERTISMKTNNPLRTRI